MNLHPTLRTALAIALASVTVVPALAQDAPLARWQASVAAEVRGNLDDAQRELAIYAISGGDRYLAPLRTGWIAFLRKDYDRAQQAYRQAIDVAPQALTPRLGLMYAARAAGRQSEAIAAADSVLAIAPGHREAALVAAELRMARGEGQRAAEALRRAHADAPEDAGVLTALTGALIAAGQKREAEQLQLRYAVLLAPARAK
jgi:tetratricopeptide (TPR) repeat protein